MTWRERFVATCLTHHSMADRNAILQWSGDRLGGLRWQVISSFCREATELKHWALQPWQEEWLPQQEVAFGAVSGVACAGALATGAGPALLAAFLPHSHRPILFLIVRRQEPGLARLWRLQHSCWLLQNCCWFLLRRRFVFHLGFQNFLSRWNRAFSQGTQTFCLRG